MGTQAARSSAQENYLKTIYELQESREGELIGIGQIASALNLTAGTVTSMVKKLAGKKLLDSQAYAGCRLTPKGRKLAIDILRRHRIVELFLVRIIGLDWSEVHDEAERLEHAVSERVLDGIEKLLDYPDTDPHGDPIPTAAGKIATQSHTRLSDCSVGDECTITRILDESKGFLAFIGGIGLYPGTAVRIDAIAPEAGTITVKTRAGAPATLGLGPAEKLLVAEAKAVGP